MRWRFTTFEVLMFTTPRCLARAMSRKVSRVNGRRRRAAAASAAPAAGLGLGGFRAPHLGRDQRRQQLAAIATEKNEAIVRVRVFIQLILRGGCAWARTSRRQVLSAIPLASQRAVQYTAKCKPVPSGA